MKRGKGGKKGCRAFFAPRPFNPRNLAISRRPFFSQPYHILANPLSVELAISAIDFRALLLLLLLLLPPFLLLFLLLLLLLLGLTLIRDSNTEKYIFPNPRRKTFP